MKNVIRAAVVAGLVLSSGALHAKDIEQGTVAILGDLDLSFVSTTLDLGGGAELETDTTSISASALYFVSRNFGLGFRWSYENQEVAAMGLSAETTISTIGPAAALNISMNDRTSFQLIGSLDYAAIEERDTFGFSDDVDGWGLSAVARLSYFLNDFVSVDGSLSYSFLELEDDSGNSADLDGAGIGLGLTVYVP
ncbi:MAG: outer membrane beta-barrel protein [Gammaproteobacteria bacterium]|jgi:hypothetical protein|nr:outer membrane beta-barrel protein [Gammaproteobacteria bacterium]